jgi:hypothetical protein
MSTLADSLGSVRAVKDNGVLLVVSSIDLWLGSRSRVFEGGTTSKLCLGFLI